MCGIVGAVANRDVVPILLEGLRKLEYRGYDSAGLAVVNGGLQRLRSVGRVAALSRPGGTRPRLAGHLGIAHTRWATHGAPTERNAHPHVSDDGLAVVHNGIIENHEAMRARLVGAGLSLRLRHRHRSRRASGPPLPARDGRPVRGDPSRGRRADRCLCHRRGVRDRTQASWWWRARVRRCCWAWAKARTSAPPTPRPCCKSPAASSTSRKATWWSCAPTAIASSTPPAGDGQRAVHESKLSADAVELGPYRHYMQKEIFEQPGAVAATLEMVTGASSLVPQLFGVDAEEVLRTSQRRHRARLRHQLPRRPGRALLDGGDRRPALQRRDRQRVSLPRRACRIPNALIITISQSGETADTIAALQHAKSLGQERTLAICNVPGERAGAQHAAALSHARRAGDRRCVDQGLHHPAGLPVSARPWCWPSCAGGCPPEAEQQHLKALRHLPSALADVAGARARHRRAGPSASRTKQHALFLGRGMHYPIALEGALKLKEISYIHAEAYPAGELKHGPLALVDRDMPVVAIAPNDALLEKLKSNLQEVRARGGELYVFADADSHVPESEGVHILRLTENRGRAQPDPARGAAAAAGLPRRAGPRHRRGQAAEPRQVGHRRVAGRVRLSIASPSKQRIHRIRQDSSGLTGSNRNRVHKRS